MTKRRFIVLKEISFGTITLGESFRWLVWLHLPAQTLLGTRVRGEPALDKWRSRRRSAARSFKYTASGTIAIKVAVQIGTIATIALALPQVICWASVAARGFLPLGGPRAQQNIQRGLHTDLLLIVTFFSCSIPWLFIVSPCGCRLLQARRSHDLLLAQWFFMPGHVRRGVHVVLPTDSCLLPLPSLRYHCWLPVRHRPCRRCKIGSSFSLANHTHVCQLEGHCGCRA